LRDGWVCFEEIGKSEACPPRDLTPSFNAHESRNLVVDRESGQ
jgi:hypothetical protein